MKTIKELATEIGVTPQSIYRKIDLLGIRDKLRESENRLKVELKEENLLRVAFGLKELKIELNESESDLIYFLKEQIKQKDEQLTQRYEEVKTIQKLLDQQQQL